MKMYSAQKQYDIAHKLSVSLYEKNTYYEEFPFSLRIHNSHDVPFYKVFPVLMKDDTKVGAFFLPDYIEKDGIDAPYLPDSELKIKMFDDMKEETEKKYFGLQIILNNYAYNNFYLNIEKGYHVGYSFIDNYGSSWFKEFGKPINQYSNYASSLGNIKEEDIKFEVSSK